MTFQTTPGLRERFTAAPTEQPRWRITAKAMYGMMDAGILTEGDPVELISGELLLRSPQGPWHVSVVKRLWLELFRVYGAGRAVRHDVPLDATEDSQPEPDISVTVGPDENWEKRHPTGPECLLVVEVAMTSQVADRAKAGLYAIAGVPQYWILDLHDRTVTVYDLPSPQGYGSIKLYSDQQDVPLPGIDSTLSIATLLR